MEFQQIDLGFSTADAEQIEFAYRGNELRLSFLDWKFVRRLVIFDGVLAQSWRAESEFYGNIRDDVSYVVHGSELVARLIECGAIRRPDEVVHHVLCFNAEGMLEIVCTAVRVIK
jgi:hypothetical protein